MAVDISVKAGIGGKACTAAVEVHTNPAGSQQQWGKQEQSGHRILMRTIRAQDTLGIAISGERLPLSGGHSVNCKPTPVLLTNAQTATHLLQIKKKMLEAASMRRQLLANIFKERDQYKHRKDYPFEKYFF